MKIALLGTGFGQAHAAVYAERPDVDDVVVFGRTPGKLAKVSSEFGFATTTDLDAVIADASVDLVDICLPTRLHAEVAVRAMKAGKDVLIELPLATTLEDARRVVAAQQASGRRAFVDMFSRFSPPHSRNSGAPVRRLPGLSHALSHRWIQALAGLVCGGCATPRLQQVPEGAPSSALSGPRPTR